MRPAEDKQTTTGLNQLEQLKKFTKIVADTGDFESMRAYAPQDATTNPSLIYAAVQKQQYAHLLDEVIADRRRSGLTGPAQIDDIIARLLVKFGCETEVMGASFRNTGQILELAGCDALTISPDLMKELSESDAPVVRKLDPAKVKGAEVEKLELDEKKFRYLLNDNAMAADKTAEGIRKFAADIVKLEKLVASKID